LNAGRSAGEFTAGESLDVLSRLEIVRRSAGGVPKQAWASKDSQGEGRSVW